MNYPNIFFKSSFGLEVGVRLNWLTNTFKMSSLHHAGRTGPRNMSVFPRYNNVQRIAAAFCSIQLRTIVRGRSFNSISKRSHNATASSIATIASLHCPKSISLGIPSMSPRSRSLNLNLPHARVSTMQSS